MSSNTTLGHAAWLVAPQSFKITMWALCGCATVLLASRFTVRITTKGRLMVYDYFLVAALPMLYVASGLLQSVLASLYSFTGAASGATHDHSFRALSVAPRLTAAIDLLWVTIYCVKFCFLAQFKFYRPPYAYVNIHLTRYYWATIVTCVGAFLFTIAVPIVLCPGTGKCRYFNESNTVAWELAVSTIDIVTDLLVISIPTLLIHMTNFTHTHTIINYIFKSLSIFAIAIAATRLALQYDTDAARIRYGTVLFLLLVEAAVAIILASISSYREVLLARVAKQHVALVAVQTQPPSHHIWSRARRGRERDRSSSRGAGSLAEVPVVKPAEAARPLSSL